MEGFLRYDFQSLYLEGLVFGILRYFILKFVATLISCLI